ncbi:tryptophan--tRNA ligase [Stutzerimonas degradans]|uniref:Tryptophan--tRNA ligase n=2 Tax=Pseudomonadaceae TaxID=135621 RepID=A0A8E2U0E6_9GAMM|nr:tryptophan--tRNA ligase [Stutzerimonas degradans]PNF75235.1 tryptophan--tRNA ligase [Stutzerimonas degradans]QPT22150.1 tryptophan--tRNA ligase [Stutzerimonas degradans]UIP87203.1 tryptophan--tRNA ligase [Pseudomonas phenolilytica]
MSSIDSQRRVVSGMRPSGRLHLGHYHGVLKSWTRLQHEYECYFCIVDWHALTTDYEASGAIAQHVMDMAVDWLAAGVSPSSATLFIQSHVPEHAELHLLLSMICPLGWLERVPSYKELQQHLQHKELDTYGFLGYPLLQAADILLYRAGLVPVGADQLPHIEFARDVARRFNHLYGREADFEDKAEAAIRRLGKKTAKLYTSLRKSYQEQGDVEALGTARAIIKEQQTITLSDQERLYGYLEGCGKLLLPEPQALLSDAPKISGLDGGKMAKSNSNAIFLRDTSEEVAEKIRRMPTDPARGHRQDPGEPTRCPVWQMHVTHSDEAVRQWAEQGCRSAGIGCLECKAPLIDAIRAELAPLQERALDYEQNTDLVRSILADGAERARDEARETLVEVRQAMGLGYR